MREGPETNSKDKIQTTVSHCTIKSNFVKCHRIVWEDSVDSFERELCKHLNTLKKYARALCKDATIADDLVQEAMLRALENRDKYVPMPGKSMGAWVSTIMRNLFLTGKRSSWRTVLSDNVEILADERSQVFESQEDALLLQQVSTIAEGALSSRHLEVLQLVGAEGYTNQQIAALLGIAEGTVKSSLHRAREALEAAMLPPLQQNKVPRRTRTKGKLSAPASLVDARIATFEGEVYRLTATKRLKFPRNRRGTARIFSIV